jgi:phosphoribosylformylglycinamidine cyclo-ligase
MDRMTYAGVGVDYGALDPFKRQAQLAGVATAGTLGRLGVSELAMSRGESAYLVETPDSFIAHVEEGLGTKNLVADAMYRLVPGRSYYDHLAQDTVAMIVNDMVTLGALPIAVAMHLAAGS